MLSGSNSYLFTANKYLMAVIKKMDNKMISVLESAQFLNRKYFSISDECNGITFIHSHAQIYHMKSWVR